MNRRSFISILGLTLIGGCTGNQSSEGDTGTTTTKPVDSTPTSSSSTTSQSHTTTTRQSPSERLTIISHAEKTLEMRFKLLSSSNGETVYDDVHTVEPNGSVDLDDQFESGEDYKFIIEHKEEKVFELTIGSYAGHEVTIQSENEVEVTSTDEI